MTRAAFLAAYTLVLRQTYAWAQEPARLDRFMTSVAGTLDGGNSWIAAGPAVSEAWRAAGGQGRPSLKALRALR